MRILLISAFFLISARLFAQQDYFYAETLIDNGQEAEAVRVLDHLIDSGAYTDRPRFEMMTQNLAGTTKQFLKDTLGAKKCFESAIACYDTLRSPLQSDDWNRREYYKANEHLAELEYAYGNYGKANTLLRTVGPPGSYFSEIEKDVSDANLLYYFLRAKIFQKLSEPDSAFSCIRKTGNYWNPIAITLDSIFNIPANSLRSVKFVGFGLLDQLSTKQDSYLYFVAWTDESNSQHSIWFINPHSGLPYIIGESTYNVDNKQNFPANCYDMSLSPDEKYLAVTCYTEGSNFIDIYDFPKIILENNCVEKQSILAYPASVEIKGWENDQLIVESGADLTRFNKKVRANWDILDNVDKKELYLFDVESGKFSKK